jgi:hypothetical protein
MARYKNEIEIEVQGLTYVCPTTPKLETIRGFNIPKKDQVWHRREEYLQWDWNTTMYDENKRRLKLWHENPGKGQMEWFEQEIERLHTGDWIMINGVPTYFNKYAYFFHQWFVLLTEQIYPSFKDTTLEYFRFFELCEEDPMTLGDCGIKGRRLGLSSMSSSIKLQIGIIENNTLQGVVSKTGTDAQEMFYMIKNGLENLPPFLVPELNKVTESELHIAKQAKRISANNKTISADKGKNNRINWLDTAENAYDGRNVRHVTIDEAGKWEKVNVRTCLSKISETLVVGASVSGHVSLFSTVNKGDKGGENFRAIWDGSDHINGKKDMFGRTQTKMKRFFIAGYRGLLGYVGKYGESIIDDPTPEQTAFLKTYINPATGKLACPNPNIGAKRYLEESRKMNAHDPELYAEVVRMYPFEWKEVFKGANNTCHFDLEELNNQIERVETMLQEKGAKENGRRGKWKELPNGDAFWVDDPAGMCYVLKFLPPEQANKRSLKGSITLPDNTSFGAAGLDTYANARQTVDKGSDACMLVCERYNPQDPDNTGMPIAMFLGRPKTKEEFHQQVALMLRYYGIKMLAERSPTDWEDYFVKKLLATKIDYVGKKEGYLLCTKRANGSEIYGIAPQDTMSREIHLTEMVEYALNNMHKILFLRILKDMIYFNIKDRTDYDACMAFGYALMGLRNAVNSVVPKSEQAQMIKTYRLRMA